MIHRPKHRLPLSGANYVVLLTFLRSAPATLVAPVLPLFLKQFVSNEAYVGYIFTATSILFLISTFIIAKILQKFKKITLFKIAALMSSLSYLLLGYLTNIYQFLLLEVFRILALTVGFFVTALYINEYSSKKTIGKNEGLYYTVANLAWLIGPLVGGLIAEAYNYKNLFLFSAIFPLLIFLLLIIKPLKEKKISPEGSSHVFNNIKDYFKNSNLIKIYFVATGVVFWITMTYIYLPLFMVDNGYSIKEIGYALFAMVVPLLLLEIPAGKLASKIGYKKIFFTGFIIISAASISTFFLPPLYTIILIISAGIGVAFIESLRDAYFFSYIKKSEELKYFTAYSTHHETGALMGPLILSSILLFTSFKVMFLAMGVFMLLFAVLSLKLKEIR